MHDEEIQNAAMIVEKQITYCLQQMNFPKMSGIHQLKEAIWTISLVEDHPVVKALRVLLEASEAAL